MSEFFSFIIIIFFFSVIIFLPLACTLLKLASDAAADDELLIQLGAVSSAMIESQYNQRHLIIGAFHRKATWLAGYLVGSSFVWLVLELVLVQVLAHWLPTPVPVAGSDLAETLPHMDSFNFTLISHALITAAWNFIDWPANVASMMSQAVRCIRTSRWLFVYW